jgi:tetratricopeptide (TPR) repeat protein
MLNEQGMTGAVSPSMRSWCAYVAGEIEAIAGRPELAERHYVRAVDLGRTSGATFLVGVATVGLLTVRAAAGHVDDALRGYREVIDYFARTGNWTHLWTTLRNLADLLRTLGDDEPAALLVAAAEHAPDAPAAVPPPPLARGTSVLHRTEVLDVARQAIERNLHGAVANDSSPTHAV